MSLHLQENKISMIIIVTSIVIIFCLVTLFLLNPAVEDQRYGVSLYAKYNNPLDIASISQSLNEINATIIEDTSDDTGRTLIISYFSEINNDSHEFVAYISNGYEYDYYAINIYLNHSMAEHPLESEIEHEKTLVEEGGNYLFDFVWDTTDQREATQVFQVEEFD